MINQDIKNQHLMLVDDDEDDRLIFGIVAREINPSLEVTMAKNGREALTLLNNTHFMLPDMILLDINMPVMNGFECLIELKKDERLKHIRALMYSTSSIRDDVKRAFDLGASHYIVKPFDMNGYEVILKKVLFESIDHRPTSPLSDDFLLELYPTEYNY